MSIINALPSAASTKRAGTRRLSVLTANVNDGDTVQVDGDVITDDSGNPVGFLNIPGGSDTGNLDTATNDDEVTVNHNIGGAGDVTVAVVVE